MRMARHFAHVASTGVPTSLTGGYRALPCRRTAPVGAGQQDRLAGRSFPCKEIWSQGRGIWAAGGPACTAVCVGPRGDRAVATSATVQPDTFPKLLIRNAEIFGTRPAIRHKDLGIWQSWTWAQVLD